MEENNSEQTIDQPSTSQIDQITKVPNDTKPKPKIKNLKRIAAGKKLAEYNRKAKEKQKAIQENEEEPVENNNNNNDSSFFPATSLTSIIALLGLSLTALDLFLRYKGQQNNSRTVEIDNHEPDEKEYEDVTKIKEIDSKSFGGME